MSAGSAINHKGHEAATDRQAAPRRRWVTVSGACAWCVRVDEHVHSIEERQGRVIDHGVRSSYGDGRIASTGREDGCLTPSRTPAPSSGNRRPPSRSTGRGDGCVTTSRRLDPSHNGQAETPESSPENGSEAQA